MTAHVICYSCDLPGKALVQNFVQYNGEYGCGYCEQPGRSLRTENGGTVRVFPYQVDAPKGERRTTTVCADQYAKDAMEYNSVVRSTRLRVILHWSLLSDVGERSERSQLAHLPEKLWSGEWYVTRLHALRSLGSNKVTDEVVVWQDTEPSHHPWCACWCTCDWWEDEADICPIRNTTKTSRCCRRQALERYIHACACMVSWIPTVQHVMYFLILTQRLSIDPRLSSMLFQS